MSASPETALVNGAPTSIWQSVKRTLRGKCPNCGNGKIWKSYIKQVDNCNSCQADLGKLRADDGPAWLTILLVGHIWAPLLVIVTRYQFPMWLLFPSLLLGATLSCLAILPISKAIFLGAIWKTQAGDHPEEWTP
ncbi:DUF983 domain-containing protein [Hirschia litorea]|uniref:DUF983 domain-containing protein n=1 Tax=Hirschia litorea TaxID=1199156 RepID=A0ABW2IIC6_9PROT